MPQKIKVDIADRKTGKSETLALEGNDASRLLGKKVGEVIDGSLIGKSGQKFRISGGSDTSGFPMLTGIHGAGLKRVRLTRGKGARRARKGELLRVTLRGETISDEIAQVNLVRIE